MVSSRDANHREAHVTKFLAAIPIRRFGATTQGLALRSPQGRVEKTARRQGPVPPRKYSSGNRVVFNIAGNKYRLVVKVNYSFGIVFVRFIGTHRQYDSIDAEAV